jgi:hypothetical protein
MDLDATISAQGINLRPDDTALYNPATNRWYTLPHPADYPRIDTAGVWAGNELLVLTDPGKLLALRS